MNASLQTIGLPPGAGRKKKVQNDDMHISQSFLDNLSSPVKLAMGDHLIGNKFDEFENEANPTKLWHNRIGTFSLTFLMVALTFALIKLAVFQLYPQLTHSPAFWFKWLDGFMVILVGIAPAALFLFSRRKGYLADWAISRFKAEMIRHWKFQQLLDGQYVEGLVGSVITVDYPNSPWQGLLRDFDGGEGYMDAYVYEKHFEPSFHPKHYAHQNVFDHAMLSYQEYRLKLQFNWFKQEGKRYEWLDGQTELAAKVLLLGGVCFAGLEGALHLVNYFLPVWEFETLSVILAALGIGVTVWSAGVRVYRSASGISESAERYKRLSSHLSWNSHVFAEQMQQPFSSAKQNKVFGYIMDIERLCHSELVEFIRVTEKSDYLI